MNAGKSTALLQSSYNYKERGMNTLVLAPEFDNRFGTGKVTSRIGIEADATTFRPEDNLLDVIQKQCDEQHSRVRQLVTDALYRPEKTAGCSFLI